MFGQAAIGADSSSSSPVSPGTVRRALNVIEHPAHFWLRFDPFVCVRTVPIVLCITSATPPARSHAQICIPRSSSRQLNAAEGSTGVVADNMGPRTIYPFEQLQVIALAFKNTFQRSRAPRQPPARALPAFRSASRSQCSDRILVAMLVASQLAGV